ncbi:tryptophan 7-halogenase [Streptomyces sp. NPDC047049]|uniref:NAD(P)/FAD-dependent oxidoreductase n=1 Tax=Streptomyces sp. NPDC047049 TaxID=3156688 RepID=UPI0033D39850
MREQTQLLIAGGGPAGSTAATLLARQGFDVRLLERDRFPRYHISESLLPSLLPILDAMDARHLVEHPLRPQDRSLLRLERAGMAPGFDEPGRPSPYSFQAIRSQFDHLLLKHAQDQGALVQEETREEGG